MQKILPPGPSCPEGKTITYISSSKYGFTNDFLADYDVCYYVENHSLFFGLKQDGELKESYKIKALGESADTYRWFMDGVELVEGVVYNFGINVKHSFAGVAADQPQTEEEYIIAQTGDNVIPLAICILTIIGFSVVLLRRRYN